MAFFKKLFLIIFIGTLFLVSCSEEEPKTDTNDDLSNKETVKIVYVNWASEEASAHVVQSVIKEKLDYECELLSVSAVAMWEAVAAGDQDAMVAAWLPSLHQHYLKEHQNQVEDLGPNLENAIMGIAVPEYVPVDSLDELKEHGDEFRHRVIGIDPGAGLMASTETMMEEYDLNEYQLIAGSDGTMTEALGNAIDDEEWILVTGWTPHWKFAQWNLKYLEDPLNTYGTGERIHTIVRNGLSEDMPEVYAFLDRFYWEPEHMEQVMLWIHVDGLLPEEAADKWINENRQIVDSWL